MAYAEKRGKAWRVKYRKPDGTEGSASGFDTKTAALKYGRKLETAAAEGKFVDPKAGRTTVADWAETWLAMIEVDELSDGTYRSRVRAQILPRWGRVAVADVRTSDHRIWMKQLRAKHSRNYAQNIEMTWRMMLDDAVVEGLVGVNPVPAARRRRGKYEPEESREDDYVYPTPLQALLLAENARVIRGDVGYAMILTKAFTGMRLAEIAALHREHCFVGPDRDPLDQVVQVEYQGHYLKGRGWTLRPPKYHSYRRLPIPPFLGDALHQVLEGHDNELAFPSALGRPQRAEGQFYDLFWKPIVEGHDELPQIRGRRHRPAIPAVPGLSGMKPHGLRHGHRVWLEEGGIPAPALDERMGHKVRDGSSVTTYRHVTPAMRRRIVSLLQREWEKAEKERRTLASQKAPS
ncbi:tyrosine-type recombinase/integrase [Streptomyces sp. UH6]|uniref:tyrosine-type recombinase/integrase n=1 Tax=Streptomyces sp. UH6 TaxID=2748379 RepID=UPI0015D4BDDF|nr:tyrosine-type recombinase/integrase [Streptomyces sp. UH6]NYV73650.1 tyrosine-type recombinase/integrase [Streptomyces sp. UH6]